MLEQCSQSLLASLTDRTRDGVEGPAPGCVQLGSPAPMALPHWFQHNPSVCLNFGAFGDWTLSRFMKRCWAGAGVTLLLGNQGPEQHASRNLLFHWNMLLGCPSGLVSSGSIPCWHCPHEHPQCCSGGVVGSTPTLLSGGSTTERGPGHHRCLLLCGGGPVDVPAAARLPLLEMGSPGGGNGEWLVLGVWGINEPSVRKNHIAWP